MQKDDFKNEIGDQTVSSICISSESECDAVELDDDQIVEQDIISNKISNHIRSMMISKYNQRQKSLLKVEEDSKCQKDITVETMFTDHDRF